MTMTNQEFRDWRKAHGWTQTEAAHQLGISMSSIVIYERGDRNDPPRIVQIPKYIELACEALTARHAGQEPKPPPKPGPKPKAARKARA